MDNLVRKAQTFRFFYLVVFDFNVRPPNSRSDVLHLCSGQCIGLQRDGALRGEPLPGLRQKNQFTVTLTLTSLPEPRQNIRDVATLINSESCIRISRTTRISVPCVLNKFNTHYDECVDKYCF